MFWSSGMGASYAPGVLSTSLGSSVLTALQERSALERSDPQMALEVTMKQLATLAATGLLAVSTSAWAQGDVNSGYDVFTCEVSVLQLEEGHSLVVWKGKGIELSAPDKPWHMSQLDCVDTTEIMADKSFKSNGYCSHTDRDGDKWISRSWRDSTMQKSRYETMGVSGKYKGSRTAGSFVYTDLSSQSGCSGVGSWEADR